MVDTTSTIVTHTSGGVLRARMMFGSAQKTNLEPEETSLPKNDSTVTQVNEEAQASVQLTADGEKPEEVEVTASKDEQKIAHLPLPDETAENTTQKKEESTLSPVAKRVNYGMKTLATIKAMKKQLEAELSRTTREATDTNKKLLERISFINLYNFQEKQRAAFSLAFLTAVISRSGTTVLEASVIFSQKNKEFCLPLITSLTAHQEEVWIELKKKGLLSKGEEIFALAPLLTLETLSLLFDTLTLPEKKDISVRVSQGILVPKEDDGKVKVGEDVWTIVRDELKKTLKTTALEDITDKNTSFNKIKAAAVAEIQKNPRNYGIDGGVRTLTPGSNVDRATVLKLVEQISSTWGDEENKDSTKEALTSAQEPVALITPTMDSIKNNTPTTEVETSEQNSGNRELIDPNENTINAIFLDEAFTKIVKMICKVEDVGNIEMIFKKYASLDIKNVLAALDSEDPLTKDEVTTFINWAKNSYLKNKSDSFESLTFIDVLNTVERGVSGAFTKTS